MNALSLLFLAAALGREQAPSPPPTPSPYAAPSVLPATAAVEQTSPGTGPSAALVESFDGLGLGFGGPQGVATVRNPSDNSLACTVFQSRFRL